MELIKKFFRWWITDSDGKEYMTLIECSLHDPVWIFLVISSLMVVFIYYKIGSHSWNKSKNYPSSTTKSYLTEKTNVFVFCAISGYLMVAISAFINPYKLRVLLNLILFFWSYKFYKSMIKTDIIDDIYKANQEVEKLRRSISEYLFQNKTEKQVDSEFLWSLPLDTWIPLDGIRFKITERTEDKIVSLTECDPNSSFGLHNHPDLTETVFVEEGHLIDEYNDYYASVGEEITYPKGKTHEPKVRVFSRYKVIFEK